MNNYLLFNKNFERLSFYKHFIFLFSITFSFNLYSQVGIGTTVPKAALEINATNQGLIIPRVALTSKNVALPVTNPQGGAILESTIVYNTATAGTTPNDVVPGYYYWDGSKWLQLATNDSAVSGDYWSLTGNTISDTDYIGTNNYKPFNIKAGGTLLGSFHPGGSIKLGENTVGSNINAFAIGYGANSATSESYAFGSSAWANSWRSLALGSNTKTDGANSVAIGNFASTGVLAANSIAIGYYATTTANEAFAIGSKAHASGDNSVALGFNSVSSSSRTIALGSGTNASNTGATALGFGATSSGLYSTAIGYNATTSQNNAIVLGDASSTSTNVGVGTSSPNAKLHIVSSTASNGFQLQDGNQGAGKVLTSDANGKATWASSVNGPVMLKGVYVPGSYANQTKHDFDLQLGTVNSDKTYFILSETVTSNPQAVIITGIQGGVDGRIITIVSHQQNFGIQLQDSNTNSAVGNRINTLKFTGSTSLQINNKGYVTLMYQISDGKWHVIDYRISQP